MERLKLDFLWWWHEQKGRRDVAVYAVWTIAIGGIFLIAVML